MKISRPIVVLVVSILGCVFAFTPLVSAQTAVTISPTKYHISLAAGQTKTLTFDLSNPNSSPVSVSAQFLDFQPEVDGVPKLLYNATSNYSLKNWLSPISDVNIAAGGTATATTTLSVPGSASGKTYYGTILFAVNGSSYDPAVGALVLLDIGTPTYSAAIGSVDTSQLKAVDSNDENGPIILTVKNTGNYMFTPNIKMSIASSSGKVVQVINGPSQGSVLPQSERQYRLDLKAGLDPSLSYTVKPYVSLPDHSTVTSSKTYAIPKKTINDQAAASTYHGRSDSGIKAALLVSGIAVICLAALTGGILLRRHHRKLQQPTPMTTSNGSTSSTVEAANQPQTYYPNAPVHGERQDRQD